MKDRNEWNKPRSYPHNQDRAEVTIFRTGPVGPVDRANPIAGCSGYFDRIGLASK
jgi:hypothetical protein